MQTLIKILKVNELKKGISARTNKPYEMQDAECLLMNDDGSVGSVGVLQLPKSLMGINLPSAGDYTAKFSLQSGMTDRKINAVLTGLTPIQRTKAS
jgi:hypothetical protein